jgi:hypothetical protein
VNPAVAAAAEQLTGEVGRVTVTDIDPIPSWWAQRFAHACGEDDLSYFDVAAAQRAGWSAIPLPPLLLSSTRAWGGGVPADDLADDGTPRRDVGLPVDSALRALGGGQRLTFHGDLVTGVPLRAEAEIVGVTPKSGRSGDLLIVEMERRFSTLDGEVLLACNENRVLR